METKTEINNSSRRGDKESISMGHRAEKNVSFRYIHPWRGKTKNIGINLSHEECIIKKKKKNPEYKKGKMIEKKDTEKKSEE